MGSRSGSSRTFFITDLDEFIRESDAGPPRKYYKLTDKGASQLAELNDYWKYINSTLNEMGR